MLAALHSLAERVFTDSESRGDVLKVHERLALLHGEHGQRGEAW
jgi:hypothetical protein